jgi:secreted protein with Ig-like and vWFA domain
MPASDDNNLETRIAMTADNQAKIIIDARDTSGAFLNNLTLSANVLDPAEQGRSVPLQQVAPGRYEATFIPDAEGAYFVAISGTQPDGSAVREVTGWVLSYSPEYVPTTTNNTLLAQIAELTGGSDLTLNPTQTFMHTAEFRTATAPAAPLLLLLVALLLPFDIAIRRLLISQSDLQRLRAYLFPARAVNVTQVERLSSLQAARRRARGEREDSAAEPLVPERPTTPTAPSEPAAPRVKITAPKPVAGDDSTVGALLKRRKRDEDA